MVTVSVATAAPDSCTVTSTGVTMTVSAAPIANLDSNATDDTICAGSAVVITADNVPGATYTFRLNGLAVPPGDVVGRVYTTSAITQESVVSVEVTNGAGCSLTGSLTIYVPKGCYSRSYCC